MLSSYINDDGQSLEDDSVFTSAKECADFARDLWLCATKPLDMQRVESLYRIALQLESDCDKDISPSSKKRRKNAPLEPLTDEEYFQTAEKYCLLLCQSGRADLASPLLSSLGFACRLSETVLNYPTDTDITEGGEDTGPNQLYVTQPNDPCIILDKFIDSSSLTQLKRILQDPNASYWTSHDYTIEPPSPYFSYLIPISSLESHGVLGQLISKIFYSSILRLHFPTLKDATQVEMWAHNRPHASGHQFHFDSDNEGRGGLIRNPLISTVLYITAEDECGGPSIVTNQTLKDRRLASKGWICHPKVGRLVAFDGKVLHGVVPGKGIRQGRRVTLMFAFWKDIRIRDGDDGHGAARSFPLHDSVDHTSWVHDFLQPVQKQEETEEQSFPTKPFGLDHIYETLDGKKWASNMGLPPYDQVFQGF